MSLTYLSVGTHRCDTGHPAAVDDEARLRVQAVADVRDEVLALGD